MKNRKQKTKKTNKAEINMICIFLFDPCFDSHKK